VTQNDVIPLIDGM